MPPLVSIVIPHFNRAKLLHETLCSLQDQTRGDWEAIVVDDGSTTEEWQQAQSFADSRVRFLQRVDGTKGPSRCRNLGLAEASAPYVMFVDSDDLVAPWCLEHRIPKMEQTPDVAFCVFPVMLFSKTPGDDNRLWNRLENDPVELEKVSGTLEHSEQLEKIPGPESSRHLFRESELDLDRFLRSDPPWHTSSPLWRQESLLKLAGFDDQIMYGDDADLHMRALLKRLPYAKIGAVSKKVSGTLEGSEKLQENLMPESSRHFFRSECLPDVFIRRADDIRITNSLSEQLLVSRVVRLERGTRLLKEFGTAEQCQLWAGQYFGEAEFLLFNVPKSRSRQLESLRLWQRDWTPSVLQRLTARSYFSVARATKKKCYLLLRIARRMAMLVLPESYFPRGGEFESAVMPEARHRFMMEQLSLNSPARKKCP